jgi:hypothetical protein
MADSVIQNATPALAVAAVVISYLLDLFQKIGGLFSFATGITSFD